MYAKLLAKQNILQHEAQFFHDKACNHKNEIDVSADFHKEYMCKVPLHLVKCIRRYRSGSVFTNHSQEHSLSISQRLNKFECSTISD